MPLTENSYGKSNVRLTKVVRSGAVHALFEIDAAIALEGRFDCAYTDGDNTTCVATDSMKNTVYVLAKESAFTSVEQFAGILAHHFVRTYPQVSRVTIELTQTAWRRIEVDGRPHDHAFTGGGAHRRVARAKLSRDAPLALGGGVRNLRVLKTTDSQWHTFVTDRYRTLKDSFDRILATQIDADWQYSADAAGIDFDAADAAIHAAILTTFANHFSLGVQQTLLAMGEAALAACGVVDRIDFALPNLHRIPFNLEPFGLTFENDIYVATDEPYGLIKGTVVRDKQGEKR
ncbi:MAG TPA: urate oxidase [Tepidisphaeraceae bacterium]|jgi:urate oxidase